MKRAAIIGFLIVLLGTHLAIGQDDQPPLTLSLRKEFGYRGGNQIQGKFILHVEGPEDLAQVQYLIDGKVIGEVGMAPFDLSFNTSAYPLGQHTVQAKGLTVDGVTLTSERYEVVFISAEAGARAAVTIILPILAGIVVVTILSHLVSGRFGRRSDATRPGEYGIAGGAVCSKCGLPFSRHVLSPNLIAGKLERCPHCERWAIVRRAGPAELEIAEAKLVVENAAGLLDLEDEEARLARQIEESRFED